MISMQKVVGKINTLCGDMDAMCQHRGKIYININNYINYIFIRVR